MKKSLLSTAFALFSILAKAQGEATEIDVNINSRNEAWYASPWLWVVGAALFILLLVAMTRGKKD